MISLDKTQPQPWPDTVDASLRLVLVHRVGSKRADELLLDLADDLPHAATMVGVAIGSWNGLRRSIHGLQWGAPLGDDLRWDGMHLTLPGVLPTIVLTAASGRRLSEIIEHPALPGDRIIVEVIQEGGGLRVVCEPEMVALADLVKTSSSPALTRRRRDAQAQRLDEATGLAPKKTWGFIPRLAPPRPLHPHELKALRRDVLRRLEEMCQEAHRKYLATPARG